MLEAEEVTSWVPLGRCGWCGQFPRLVRLRYTPPGGQPWEQFQLVCACNHTDMRRVYDTAAEAIETWNGTKNG